MLTFNALTAVKWIIPGLLVLTVLTFTYKAGERAGRIQEQVNTKAERIAKEKAEKELTDTKAKYQENLAKANELNAQISANLVELKGALDEAAARERAQTAALMAARNELVRVAAERLRLTSDLIASRNAAASGDSPALTQCKADARALGTVFDACRKEYVDLGRDAEAQLEAARNAGKLAEQSYDAARQALKEAANAGTATVRVP